MTIRVFNTMTKEKMPFEPLREGKVGMYVCGPTVYDSPHIGHARAAVVFDVIYRYLRYRGYEVTYVRNVTDVDDKIIERAKKEGKAPQEISERYLQEYWEAMSSLHVESPSKEPRVTDHIPQIIDLIKVLLDKNYSYVVEGNVYFSVEKFAPYGKLSKRDRESMMAGARVEVDPRKRNPLDFALWKASKPGEPWWESPWGKGRPGWHIECSAMSMTYLGETLDIHGGGKDLIFPHHENEIAQSEAATGKEFVRYWIHNGFVNVDSVKMSKSLGNYRTVKEVLEQFDAEVVRLFLLMSHYRSPIDFTLQSLQEAEKALERYYRTLQAVDEALGGKSNGERESQLGQEEIEQKFIEAMDDDFNTAMAIGVLFEGVRLMNRALEAKRTKVLRQMRAMVRRMGSVLGVGISDPAEYLTKRRTRKLEERALEIEEVERLIQERAEARKNRDWERADRIREELKKKGIILEDTPQGTVWRIE